MNIYIYMYECRYVYAHMNLTDRLVDQPRYMNRWID